MLCLAHNVKLPCNYTNWSTILKENISNSSDYPIVCAEMKNVKRHTFNTKFLLQRVIVFLFLIISGISYDSDISTFISRARPRRRFITIMIIQNSTKN